ncbi:MAG: Rpn family recombination-promoting nuclease/putative transposase, partial [Desulfamplus sp.]|nr:Rpn family recombination-promoting nuclease/putative transposase [Desulfamplus sp.]
ERKFIDDKLSIVDIKASCQNNFQYQIEIQLAVYPSLPSRILYNWSTIYQSQLTKQKPDYSLLRPVYSIWILDSPLFKDAGNYHLKFGLHDLNNNISLTDHLSIHLLQLSIFNENKDICNEIERWLYFFKQAENQDLSNLPKPLKTEEMIQAMETLKDFSENQKNYLLYQSRIDAQLERNTWKKMLREAALEATSLRKEKEKERKEKEKERKEKEFYLKMLKEKGIDVDNLNPHLEDKAE